MYPIATRTTMRIHLVQLAVFAFLLVPTLTAQTLPMDTIWTRYIGEGGSESRPSVARIPEGGYWVSCESIMLGASGNVLLTRLEEDGDTLFSRRVGFHDVRGMIGCTDGGAVLFGETFNRHIDSSWNSTQWVERVSASGASLWSVSIGADTLNAWTYSLVQTSDSGFVAIGQYSQIPRGDLRGIIAIKLAADGTHLWSVIYPNINDSTWSFRRADDIQEAPDGTLLVTGSYLGYDMPNPDAIYAFWMRLSAQGEIIESIILPEDYTTPLRVVALPNQNFMVASRCTPGQFCMAELSLYGDVLWANRFSLGGGTGWTLDLDIGPNDTRVLTVQLDGHLYFIGLSEDGDSLYTVSSYASGISSSQIAYVVADTFLVTHSIQGLIPPYSDILVSKFLLPGSVSDVSNELRNEVTVSTFSLAAYPNPFNSTLAISLDVPLHQEITVSLYDLLGREVDVIHRGRLNSSAISYTTPASLSSGVYFLRAVALEHVAMQKIVLLK